MLVNFTDSIHQGKPLVLTERLEAPLVFPDLVLRAVAVVARAQKAGSDLWLELNAQAVAELQCDRCLQALALPLAASSRERLRYVSGHSGLDLIDEAGADLYVFGDAPVDLLPLVRQALYLALPDQALCQSDCQGLCPTCGADRNRQGCPHQWPGGPVDPRLAALAELNL